MSTEPTPAVQRATRAVSETAYGVGVEMADREIAVDALDAALDVEEMAAKLWELEYRRDVGGLPGFPWRDVREPIKKIYRDQARDLRAALLGEEAKTDG